MAAGRLVPEKQFPQAGRRVRRDRRPDPRLAAADLRRGPAAGRAGPPDPQGRPLGPRRAARQRARHGRRVGQGIGRRAHLARRGLPAGGPGGDGRRRAGGQLRLRVRARASSSSTRSPVSWSAPSRSPAWPRRCSGCTTDAELRQPAGRGRAPRIAAVRRRLARRALGRGLRRRREPGGPVAAGSRARAHARPREAAPDPSADDRVRRHHSRAGSARRDGLRGGRGPGRHRPAGW